LQAIACIILSHDRLAREWSLHETIGNCDSL
jgi:hypothetical protein